MMYFYNLHNIPFCIGKFSYFPLYPVNELLYHCTITKYVFTLIFFLHTIYMPALIHLYIYYNIILDLPHPGKFVIYI